MLARHIALIARYQTPLTTGLLAGLLFTTIFFSATAAYYKQRADQLSLEQRAIDQTLLRIEKSLIQIQEFRDKIDELTTTTVGRDSAIAADTKRHLAKISQSLTERRSFNSPEERAQNNRERIDEVAEQTSQTTQTLRAVSKIMNLRKDILDGVPSIAPAAGWISSTFGVRKSPFSGDQVIHNGLDIGADEGTPIYASADGTVASVTNSDTFGNLLVIRHASNIVTKYAHTASILVVPGQRINRGDLVATIGSTGRSTGPHLHYEVHFQQRPVDPLDYLLDHQITDVYLMPNYAIGAIGGEGDTNEIDASTVVAESAAKFAASTHSTTTEKVKDRNYSFAWVAAVITIILGIIGLSGAFAVALVRPKATIWEG